METGTTDFNSLQELNSRFRVAGKVEFEAGTDSFAFSRMNWEDSKAVVFLYGGQVTELRFGKDSVLWLSPEAVFETGKAIRGGVPVCWPWFGPHPDDPEKPGHGFVRNQTWRVAGSSSDENATQLKLELTENQVSRRYFDAAFKLELNVVLNNELKIELTSTNLSHEAISVGGALHSYFAVEDIAKMEINGLEGCAYVDKLDSNKTKSDAGPLRIAEEVDRVYLDESPHVSICAGERSIAIKKSGSRSTVVWNPWSEKAKRMSDVPDDAYKSFVCVETANAFEDVRTLEPGQSHTLTQQIELQSR